MRGNLYAYIIFNTLGEDLWREAKESPILYTCKTLTNVRKMCRPILLNYQAKTNKTSNTGAAFTITVLTEIE